MIEGKKILNLVMGDDRGAGELVRGSGIQFRVANHHNWCRYDPPSNSLMDMDTGAVVPAKLDDITTFRFGDTGAEHTVSR